MITSLSSRASNFISKLGRSNPFQTVRSHRQKIHTPFLLDPIFRFTFCTSKIEGTNSVQIPRPTHGDAIIVEHQPLEVPSRHNWLTQDQKREMKILRRSDPIKYTQQYLAKMFNVSTLQVARYAKCPTKKKEQMKIVLKEEKAKIVEDKKSLLSNWVQKNQKREWQSFYAKRISGVEGRARILQRLEVERVGRQTYVERQLLRRMAQVKPDRPKKKLYISQAKAKKLANVQLHLTEPQGF